MKFLLDTNVLSLTLRDANSAVAITLKTHSRSDLVVPSVVCGELLFGALKGEGTTKLRTVQTFLSEFPSLPFDDLCVQEYAVARAELERTGQRIGALDLMIAAIALAHRLVLVTHNTAEFGRVAGLRCEDWNIGQTADQSETEN